MNTEQIKKLVACVEHDLRKYLLSPSEYQAEYLEDTHACITEVCELLGIALTDDQP